MIPAILICGALAFILLDDLRRNGSWVWVSDLIIGLVDESPDVFGD